MRKRPNKSLYPGCHSGVINTSFFIDITFYNASVKITEVVES